jgi:hypothetical protein
MKLHIGHVWAAPPTELQDSSSPNWETYGACDVQTIDSWIKTWSTVTVWADNNIISKWGEKKDRRDSAHRSVAMPLILIAQAIVRNYYNPGGWLIDTAFLFPRLVFHGQFGSSFSRADYIREEPFLFPSQTVHFVARYSFHPLLQSTVDRVRGTTNPVLRKFVFEANVLLKKTERQDEIWSRLSRH